MVSTFLAIVLGQTFSSNPSEVQLHFEDVDRFYSVLESSTDEELKQKLPKEYLEGGSKALSFFRKTKIRFDPMFVQYVQRHRKELLARKATIAKFKDTESRIRAEFFAFKYLNPDAKFPPIHFVIGRESSGGTSCQEGLIIGAEMTVNDPATLPNMIAHELIHFNQKLPSFDLLSATLAEGMADFLAELISGDFTNHPLHRYGNAHESEIWIQWKHDVSHGNKLADWIGASGQKQPRPGDLGYYVGYKICRSFYEKSQDKLKAIHELLSRTDAAKIVEESGYDPK